MVSDFIFHLRDVKTTNCSWFPGIHVPLKLKEKETSIWVSSLIEGSYLQINHICSILISILQNPSRVKTSVLNSVQLKNARIADYRQLVCLLHTTEESVAVNYFPKTEAKLFAFSQVKCLGV